MSKLSAWIQTTEVPLVRSAGRALLSRLRIRREFAVDRKAYLGSSAWRKADDQEVAHLQRDLTFWYHQVEKALTFAETRRPFGVNAEVNLRRLLTHPLINQVDSVVRDAADDALSALLDWNSGAEASKTVAPPAQPMSLIDDAASFFRSRQSCRNFDTSRRISDDEVEEVVGIAQSAPSVCNRQGARLHYLKDPGLIAAALALQSGNRGFGDSITHLAVVTVDRRAFSESTERNQGWIDGGLFAMTFVWALHARGFASCMLNWSMGVTATRALRLQLDLPDHEDVICMVAFGYGTTGSRRARSARIPLSSVMSVH